MYLIAFAIGAVVPIAGIIAAGAVTDDTAWRSANVLVPDDEARSRGDVEWRHEYVGGQFVNRAYERRTAQGPLLLLGLAWSGATLIAIAGVTAAAWIVVATGERLGIDRARGYLRGMFLMAFATGGLVPIAALIAAGTITANSPSDLSERGTALLIVMWCGMIAVCIAGLFSAAWLVKTAAAKLRPAAGIASFSEEYPPRYAAKAAFERQV
jgi:hypothetical protein